MSTDYDSLGPELRAWAQQAGGYEVAWEGEGADHCTGYLGADGSRTIKTNGDPVFEEACEEPEEFRRAWRMEHLTREGCTEECAEAPTCDCPVQS